MATDVSILYDHEGKTCRHIIKPLAIWFGRTRYCPEQQWLLHAWDYKDEDFMHFAMSNVKDWKPGDAPPLD